MAADPKYIQYASTNQIQSSFETETILLVEGDPNLRQFIRHELESCGYKVLEAEHGPAAISTAVRHSKPIQLLLAENMMPEITGFELAKCLQVDHLGLQTLLMTGITDDTNNLIGVNNASTYSFIQKPFQLTELLTKVRSLLHNRGRT